MTGAAAGDGYAPVVGVITRCRSCYRRECQGRSESGGRNRAFDEPAVRYHPGSSNDFCPRADRTWSSRG